MNPMLQLIVKNLQLVNQFFKLDSEDPIFHFNKRRANNIVGSDNDDDSTSKSP